MMQLTYKVSYPGLPDVECRLHSESPLVRMLRPMKSLGPVDTGEWLPGFDIEVVNQERRPWNAATA
jgi:hypothetical protein